MTSQYVPLRTARVTSRTLTRAVEEHLRAAIENGVHAAGSQLPTEAEIGHSLGASRTVVREALRTLEDDGLIVRRHGVGTFVRKEAILKNLNLNFGITEMIQRAGAHVDTAFLHVWQHAADDEVESALDVPGAKVITIERVRTANGRPVVYSLDTLVDSLVDENVLRTHLAGGESLYSVIETERGSIIDHGIARVKPVRAAAHISHHLKLPRGAVLLYIAQTDYSTSDEPILYSREYHLPNAFDFVIWRRGPSRTITVDPSRQATHGL